MVHVHALETDRAGRDVRNTMYYVERLGLQMADKVIAVSEYTRQMVHEHYGIRDDKIVAIHNGIDPSLYSAKSIMCQRKLWRSSDD